MEQVVGHVVQVQGSVVDVEFKHGKLPEIYEALEVLIPDQEPLILEVEKHLGEGWVRCVSMNTTDGMQRGMPTRRTFAPISVPVGPTTLGRIFNVLGQNLTSHFIKLQRR